MDISGLMNIHDFAMTKTIKQQADVQGRQEKTHQWIERQDENQTPLMGNKTPLEAYPGALTNTVKQQVDPQAVKIRVERQVDAQSTKETAQGPEEKVHTKAGAKEIGTLINIIS